MDFRSLQQARPETLRQAGKRWSQLSDKLLDRAAEVGNKIRDRVADDAVWSGDASEAAHRHITDLHAKMDAYAPTIAELGAALNSAGDDIDTQQHALVRLVSEINGREGFEVAADGKVSWPANQESQGQNYLTEMNSILERANGADQSCAQALAQGSQRLDFLKEVIAEERKEERADGQAAAKQLQHYLQQGEEPPPALLRELKRNAEDEYYAAAMANQLGTKGLLDIPAMLGEIQGLDPQQRDAAMTSVAHMLGTATNGEGPDVRAAVKQDLIKAAGSTELMGQQDEHGFRGQGTDHLGYRKFWAMQKMLQYGKGEIGGDFLAQASEQIYRNRDDLRSNLWDHQGGYDLEEDEWSRSGLDTAQDPMLTAVDSLATDGEAGRQFYGHDPNGDGKLERVSTLMEEYPHNTPDGEKVSESLRVASTEFETLDPDRDNPDHRRAAAIASNYLHTAADAERGFSLDGPTSQEVKRDLSSVLSYYYEDVNNALIGGDAGDSEVPIGMQDANAQDDARRLPESEMGFTTGAAVQYDDAKTLLNTVWDDETSQRRVLGAATVYSNESIQYKVDHWDSINNTGYDSVADARNSGYRDYGANLRGLVDAVYAEEISNAESNQEIAKIMKPVVQVGLVASGPGGLGAAALGGVANASLDELGGGVAEAQDAHEGEIQELNTRSNVAVAEMMLRRGEWDAADIPEQYQQYWSEEEGRFKPPENATELRYFRSWVNRYSDTHSGDEHAKFMDGLQAGMGS